MDILVNRNVIIILYQLKILLVMKILNVLRNVRDIINVDMNVSIYVLNVNPNFRSVK